MCPMTDEEVIQMPGTETLDMPKVVARLWESTTEDRNDGYDWGREWAADYATLSELRDAAEAVTVEDLPASVADYLENSGGGAKEAHRLRRHAFMTGLVAGARQVLIAAERADPTLAGE